MQISALVAESFFGTLKNEWLHHEPLMDAEATRHLAIEFIESYYNRFRPHESPRYLQMWAAEERYPAAVVLSI